MVDHAVRSITLSGGMVALVDAMDFEALSERRWFVQGRKWQYAACNAPSDHGKKFLMHRIVVGALPGQIVDHINGDTLDNRRCNLRICTNQQNTSNGRTRGGTSRFKGVYWNKASNAWRAHIMHNYRKLNLGNYATEEEAGRAYDAAALRLFGEFARLNFPVETAVSP